MCAIKFRINIKKKGFFQDNFHLSIIRYIQFHEKINENTFQLSIGKNPFLVQIELLRNHP